MSTHILSENVVVEFEQLGQTTELRDAAGRILGFFVPAFDPSQYEIIGPEPTAEEIRRIEESDEWYSTDEVLRHLENLR